MTKGLEALERLLGNQIFISLDRQQGKKQLAIDLNTIEKELKALEILIRKNINLWIFKNTNSYRAYIEGCYLHEQCSKEEYDSLKLLKESERV